MRWVSLVAGIALVAIAFAAGSRVADTREGLIAEVVALLGGLAGISLVLYGLLAGSRRAVASTSVRRSTAPAVRPGRDVALGSAGLILAAVLLSGLALSGGWQWAVLGLALLLPMIAGSAYLCARFLRAR
ncbi:MAG: hypothetical protein ABI334_04160 [Candidatus Dormiibacterota bacterium]